MQVVPGVPERLELDIPGTPPRTVALERQPGGIRVQVLVGPWGAGALLGAQDVARLSGFLSSALDEPTTGEPA